MFAAPEFCYISFLLLISSGFQVVLGHTEITWSSLEEFKTGGWDTTNNFASGVSYDKPSSIKEEFTPLDSSSMGPVWTPSNQRDYAYFSFWLDLGYPNFCKITAANLTIKVYYSPNRQLQIWPCLQENGNLRCNFTKSNERIEWVEYMVPIHFGGSHSPFVHIRFIDYESDYNHGDIVLDDVTLSHNSESPNNCQSQITSTHPSSLQPTSNWPTTTPTTGWPTTTPTTRWPTTPTTGWPTASTPPPIEYCDHDCEYRAIDCHNYYTCVNYTYKQFHTCPKGDGLAFNPKFGICDNIKNVLGCDCKCDYKPDRTNCSNYYFCRDTCNEDQCELRTCQDGMLWSVDFHLDGSGHQQCQLRNKTMCGQMVDLKNEIYNCNGKENGNYRREGHCGSYWKCEEGNALLIECSEGRIYNPELGKCQVFSEELDNGYCQTE